MPTPKDTVAKARPANTINVDEAFARVHALPTRERSRDNLVDVQKAALVHASQSMTPALGALGVLVREHPLQVLSNDEGWRLYFHGNTATNTLDFVLLQDGVPGASLVSILYKPGYTTTAQTAAADLDARIDAAYEACGKTFMDRLLETLKKGPSVAPELAAEKQALKDDPQSYRPITTTTPVVNVRIVALSIDGDAITPSTIAGHHPSLDDDSTQPASTSLWPVSHEGYAPGLQAELQPISLDNAYDDVFLPARTNSGAMPGIALVGLSALLVAHGLEEQVRTDNAKVSATAWWSSDVGPSMILEEAGYAAVCASEGLYDARVVARIAGILPCMLAGLFSKRADELRTTALGMLDAGYHAPDTSLSCNDGRDVAHVTREDGVLTLHTVTQHGVYRLSFLDGDSGPVGLIVQQRDGKHVGRFLYQPDGGLKADFETSTHGPAIPYTLSNIRDVYQVYYSLTSVACVFAEEQAEKEAETS